MKRFFPFLFLFILFLNVTSPLVEQLQGGDLYELVELGTDDADAQCVRHGPSPEFEVSPTVNSGRRGAPLNLRPRGVPTRLLHQSKRHPLHGVADPQG